MAPGTNFKTYETQARLLSALVASLGPDVRLDYKKIASYYGGGTTESAMEHRFRAVKAQATVVAHLVDKEGEDPADYETWSIKREDLQKMFGASTPEGLAFQFRTIKHGAKVLKDAAAKGEDPVAAFNNTILGGSSAAGGPPSTPSGRTPGSSRRARSSKAATPSVPGASPATKRRRTLNIDPELDDDEDSTEVDYEALDTTPTKLLPKVKSTPKKNPGELVPRSMWAKPAKKTAEPVRKTAGPVPIAPAPPRPAAPSLSLAPIPGVASRPSTGPTIPGHNTYPASLTMGSAASSAANSPAMGVNTAMRRGSTFSAGSGSFPGSPAANMSMSAYPDAGGMTTSAAHSQYPQVPAQAAVGTNVPPYRVFDSASPSASASEVSTPQAAATTYPVTAPPMAATSNTTPSFKTEEYCSSPSSSFMFGSAGTGYDTGNLYSASSSFAGLNNSGSYSNNINNGHHTYGYDEVETADAAQIDFGGANYDQEDWEDAADC